MNQDLITGVTFPVNWSPAGKGTVYKGLNTGRGSWALSEFCLPQCSLHVVELVSERERTGQEGVGSNK